MMQSSMLPTIIIIMVIANIAAQTVTESFGNAGRPILGSKKKERVDLGPPIIEENEVQILVDADWDENLLFHPVYLVLFHEAGCQETDQFLPEFEAAADVLIVTEPFTPLAKVECGGGGGGKRKTTNICQKITAALPTIRYNTYMRDGGREGGREQVQDLKSIKPL